MQKFSENFQNLCYTDMACELYRQKENEHRGDILHETHRMGEVMWERLRVPDRSASEALGKSVGTYYTVHTGDLHLKTYCGYSDALCAIKHCIRDAIGTLLPAFSVPNEKTADGISPCDTGIDSPGEEAEEHLAVSPEWDRGQRICVTDKNEIGNTELPMGNVHVEASVSEMIDLPPVPLQESWGKEEDAFRPYSVLCVGLGNPALTPDALGPRTVSELVVTHHLTDDAENRSVFGDCHRVSAFVPAVRGMTGLETLDLVRGAAAAAKPDLVILIDALAASETSSLIRCVQIATTGVHPGGGIGNKREALTKETLGVPVITVGVPTVIGAATFVLRALEQTELLPAAAEQAALRTFLSDISCECVTPKDIDTGVADAARLLSRTLNELLLGVDMAREFARP